MSDCCCCGDVESDVISVSESGCCCASGLVLSIFEILDLKDYGA